jgi:hypothetical protein
MHEHIPPVAEALGLAPSLHASSSQYARPRSHARQTTNTPPHHLHSTRLPSTRTVPRGVRRKFRADERLVRSLARTAREGLGS